MFYSKAIPIKFWFIIDKKFKIKIRIKKNGLWLWIGFMRTGFVAEDWKVNKI